MFGNIFFGVEVFIVSQCPPLLIIQIYTSFKNDSKSGSVPPSISKLHLSSRLDFQEQVARGTRDLIGYNLTKGIQSDQLFQIPCNGRILRDHRNVLEYISAGKSSNRSHKLISGWCLKSVFAGYENSDIYLPICRELAKNDRAF